jgi:signal transduction histidine kinase
MIFSHLKVSSRILVTLAIALGVQIAISAQSLINFRHGLITDRQTEVKHLVESAYTVVASYHDSATKGLMSDVEAREAARAAVRAMRFDGDNYYFIWDRDGVGISHGSHPEFEGVNFIDSPQARALPYVSDMVAKLVAVGRTASGKGFTSYNMTKPGGSKPLAKIAYNELFAPWGWNIGTGAYTDDIDAAFWEQARTHLLIIGGMIALAGLCSFFLTRDFTAALTRLTGRIDGLANGEFLEELPESARRDEVGMIARALAAMRDKIALRTTQLQETQDQLIRKERLSAIGQITATVAHELKNPLSTIKNSLYALKNASGDAAAMQRPAGRIERGVERCDRIIADLLSFTHSSDIRRTAAKADSIVKELLDDYEPRKSVTLAIALDAPNAIVSLDLDRFRRVLINLLDNAGEALEAKGCGASVITVSSRASSAYELKVEDTGPGIEPAILSNIFEPLFTTKAHGTGLGLPTARQIVEQHDGRIEVDSMIGQGTTFTLRFPIVPPRKIAA